jgi:hypothetical protein
MTEPTYVSDELRAETRRAGFPWCDACGEPAVWRESQGWLHSTDVHRFGLPQHLDQSGHEVTARQWWEDPRAPQRTTGRDTPAEVTSVQRVVTAENIPFSAIMIPTPRRPSDAAH